MLKALSHQELDCETFAYAAKKQHAVIVEEIEDLSGKIPHVGAGGGSKSKYVSPKTGKTIFVLERNNWYAGDAYTNDVWLFDSDFTAEEADEFIRAFDQNRGHEYP